PDIRIADASWYLPTTGRDGRAEFMERHIPGAFFFDIDEISDQTSGLPHMLPDPAKFASRAKKLGLGDGNRVVVYDGAGIFASARVWWMVRAMGHRDVSVLDGGFPKWLAEGRPVDDNPVLPRERHFTPRPDNMLIRNREQMPRNLQSRQEQVLDARPAGRFHGRDPEPRPGLRGGHIPGSLNLPYTELLNADGTMKAPDALRLAFRGLGVDPARPVTATCGSGVSAAIILLALAVIGAPDGALYDGAWAEWGADAALPLET
ncbi:MAG TPA: 3-mercaptopyruvate sulfurtransferase, partial [Alphaproteobacteria bacterium]|nr:3-mercaptopyruvate sulfurtransferase [Alphaproteobacteria bacterium]